MARRRHEKKESIRERLFFPIGLLFFVGVLAGLTNMRSADLREQEQSYIEREAKLQEQIDAEHERTEELEQRKKYVGTKQYIEEVARDRLGLIDPDEILIQENKDD